MVFTVLVCGSRDYDDWETIYITLDAVRSMHGDVMVVHGGATGADELAGEWAETCQVPCKVYEADWGQGKDAGIKRNTAMLLEAEPDLVLAFLNKPLSHSRGTNNMAQQARRAGVKTRIVWNYEG